MKIDVIVGHLYGSSVYCSLVGGLTGTPVISVLHGQSDLHDAGRFASIKKAIVRRGAHRVVFVSRALRRELEGHLQVPEQKCVVIPNGIDVEKFSSGGPRSVRDEVGASSRDVLVGAIGNLRRPKAYDVFLKAAHILRASSGRYKFLIAGDLDPGIYGELSIMCQELGLNGAVKFLGHRSDIDAILRSLDVYVLSSDTEGFSISCLEAMASGVPVIATRSGGPEEIIVDRESGLLVPPRDSQAIADAVHWVVSNPDRAQLLVKNAIQEVKNRFTTEKMVRSYAKVLGECSGARV